MAYIDTDKYGSAYSGLVSANPYSTVDYRKSGWQKFLTGLGFRTNYDAYKESLALQSKEYEASIAAKAYDEQYDSAAAQVQREREAGINPDIAGDVSPGGSSPLQDDGNPAIAPTSDMDTVAQAANVIMNVFTTAVGLGKETLALTQMAKSVESQSLGNVDQMFNLAMGAAKNFIPENMPVDDPDWKNRSSAVVQEIVSPFMSKKQLRGFRNSLNAFYNSAPTTAEQYKSWYDKMHNRQDAFGFFKSQYYDDIDDCLMDAIEPLVKAMDKIKSKGLENEEQRLENEGTYLQNIDTGLQAEVENMTNERNKASSSIDAILNEAMNEILSNLKDRSESNRGGHSFAGIALLAFSLFRMMNFSRTSGTTATGAKTSSMSFGF